MKSSHVKPSPQPSPESVHDILRIRRQPLDVFFSPRAVAVIGATETPHSVGRTLLSNLLQTPFGGTVFPVNPKHPRVLGVKTYPTIAAVPDKVDLAVVVTPAPTVPGIIRECVQAGVKGAIVISAGFKEVGAAGIELERDILMEARRGKIRVIGPNCLGVMSPVTGLNATFASHAALPGQVAFVSQSGALGTAILDWSLQERVGFSSFISLGSMLDVGWSDVIDYLGDDPHTTSILLYMETIGAARAFLSAAREVALTKPIIVLKAGRTEEAARAASSHTGSLAGSDEVLAAAFQRCGVLRVNRIADLFYMAEVLAKQPRAHGPRLAIVTNAGGPGVIATDALVSEGGCLAELSPETVTALNGFLPAAWSHNNPIDILGDADPERYARALEVVAHDTSNDGLLVILTPQAMTDPTKTADRLAAFAKLPGKPLLASWMGGAEVAAGSSLLSRSGIPCFPYSDTAVRAFNYLWRYSANLRHLYETPALVAEGEALRPQRSHVKERLQHIRQGGRTLLTEAESKEVLSAYGIPVVETRAASDEQAAIEAADALGYPVAVKLWSETLTHKSDVGGVQLNLTSREAVSRAYRAIETSVRDQKGPGHFKGVTVQPMVTEAGYELILGSAMDPQFGPVLLFGSGGQLVEVYKDRALGLPPLNTTLARRMIEQTRIYRALQGVRGRPPVDLAALEQLMVRFSLLVVEQHWIKEIDINPLLVTPQRFLALDARIILHDPQTPDEALPPLSIRPYPARYIGSWTMKNGTPITIHPIRPEDEPILAKFHEALSEQSVYLRYFSLLKLSERVAHDRLIRRCFNDYDRELALVATRPSPSNGGEEMIGIGRLSKLHGSQEAEFSVLIKDQFQRQGLGTEMISRLIQIARDENVSRIFAEMLPQNLGMAKICERLGFQLTDIPGDSLVHAELKLEP